VVVVVWGVGGCFINDASTCVQKVEIFARKALMKGAQGRRGTRRRMQAEVVFSTRRRVLLSLPLAALHFTSFLLLAGFSFSFLFLHCTENFSVACFVFVFLSFFVISFSLS